MPVRPEEVVFVRETFGLSQRTLAKVLNVHQRTVYRWERGEAKMDGLAEDVLRALHTAALTVGNDPRKRASIGGKLAMGIGSLIYTLLLDEFRSGAT